MGRKTAAADAADVLTVFSAWEKSGRPVQVVRGQRQCSQGVLEEKEPDEPADISRLEEEELSRHRELTKLKTLESLALSSLFFLLLLLLLLWTRAFCKTEHKRVSPAGYLVSVVLFV